MERENKLGLDAQDLVNLDEIMEDLMDILARMNTEEYTEEHLADFHNTVDYCNFVLKGIIYKNGFDPCAGHDHDDDDDDDD